MQIKDMFRKKIDREIQGVIIVGQGEETNVAQELEEYVVTRELQRHFADFFAAYKKGIQGTTPKMGVWISGFFGSGKSCLLYTSSPSNRWKRPGKDWRRDWRNSGQPTEKTM